MWLPGSTWTPWTWADVAASYPCVMELDIRIFGDPVLRQRAREVDSFDDHLVRLADAMMTTMLDAPGVGLAAPQVGVLKRLFTWAVADSQGAVVNPVIVDASDDTLSDDEGCLSFPGLFYPVARPLTVTVAHQDLGGDDQRRSIDGFLARVFLHEIDHLNGVLFIDHLARHDRKDALARMRALRSERGLDVEPRRGSLLGRLGR